MWMINPKKMCRQHLLGEHKELHQLIGSLNKGKSVKGHLDKGQIEIHKIKTRHEQLVKEMKRRGYNHNSKLLKFKDYKAGKINISENEKELIKRCNECRKISKYGLVTTKNKVVTKDGQKYKALIFDVGGVLQLPKFPVSLIQDSHLAGVPAHCGHRNKGVHEYLANKLKVVLDQWFDGIDTVYAKSIEGKISRKQLLKTLSKNFNVSEKKLEKWLVNAYKSFFEVNKELINYAKKLKKKGYKVAILSDQWHFSKDALVTKQMINLFRPIIISCDVGLRKPNPKIYKLTLKKLKIPAKQTIFIDNQQWNMTPAKKLGMKTILFKDNKQLFKQLNRLLEIK